MKRNRKIHAAILRLFVISLILSVLLSVCCAAADEEPILPGSGQHTAPNVDLKSLFPHELPSECASWKEYRIRHSAKPEHAVHLRTLLPRMLHKLPEEPEETAEGGSDPSAVSQDDLQYLDSFIATAYYLTGYTSTGAYTTVNHTLAVNPNIIPYGTHVWIWLEDGTYVGDFYAEDTGSNMMAHPYVIDIYMGNDYDACIQWGARRVLVYTE